LYDVIAKELGFTQGLPSALDSKPTEEEVTLMAFAYLSNKGVIPDVNSLGNKGRLAKGLTLKSNARDDSFGDFKHLMVGGRTPQQIISPEKNYVIGMQHALKKKLQEQMANMPKYDNQDLVQEFSKKQLRIRNTTKPKTHRIL